MFTLESLIPTIFSLKGTAVSILHYHHYQNKICAEAHMLLEKVQNRGSTQMQGSQSTEDIDDPIIANKCETVTMKDLWEQEVQTTMKVIYRDRELLS